jgi:hypothetical protein
MSTVGPAPDLYAVIYTRTHFDEHADLDLGPKTDQYPTWLYPPLLVISSWISIWGRRPIDTVDHDWPVSADRPGTVVCPLIQQYGTNVVVTDRMNPPIKR